jgi:superoxide dismutase, Fe-Mn family
MNYIAKTFTIPALTGISKTSIDEHIKLYNGYVKHYNLINDILGNTEADEHSIYSRSETNRRLAFEWCGIKNHEYYFEQLQNGYQERDNNSAFVQCIISQFGDWDSWMNSFTALAKTRGIGWAMLWRERETGTILQSWVDEQHLGQLSSCDVLLALDMWEHSYVADYQPSGKGQYITDYLANIDWSVIERRFDTNK